MHDIAHAIQPPMTGADAATSGLLRILDLAATGGCSDIHVRAHQGVFGRVSGRVLRLDVAPPSPEEVQAMIEVTARRPLPAVGGSKGHFEYSFEARDRSRYRTHAFLEDGRWAMSIRVVPLQIPTFSTLRLPPVVKSLCDTSPGLLLITGPTGSGKSTTAASMLEFIVSSSALHIVTLEDPIEYRLKSATACVTQREIGRDTPSFTEGALAAMREDPDVLFIGEIATPESIETALSIAESGHFVISTYHTHSCQHTINRLIASFSAEVQSTTRERLADALKGIVSQRLLPLQNGSGLVLATETLVNNYSVKEHIRDPLKLRALTKFLEKANDQGMHSFDQSLYHLVSNRIVDASVALGVSASPAEFRRRFKID
jgi:twitching motility protein PilT